ncbi:MAG: hypothetical protein EP330_01580 [Deltaproteobacteria bacterium]|nr:MAG: hypothetical protein EP330_01580 [Deltaproteobacteria bacterium]
MRFLIPALLLVGCGENLGVLPNEPGGNPLVPEIGMYPYPSDFYRVDGQLAFDERTLPEGLPPELFADNDGFSRIVPILTHLPGGFDRASLPGPTDAAATVAGSAPVLLVNGRTHERVPHLAEIDGYVEDPSEAALIIRPLQALDPATPYVVILRDSLLAADGSTHVPTEAFRALRDGLRTDTDAVEAQRDDFEIVNTAIDEQALDPEEVVLAWVFTTASRERVTGPTYAMAAHMAEASLGDVQLGAFERDGNNDVAYGTFTAPNFLGEDNRVEIVDGEPVVQGTAEVEFSVTIPDSVTEPRPVIAFGHGFFSSIDEPTWSAAQAGMQPWAMSAVATPFLGFQESDQLASAGILAGDLARLPEIVDQQRQSQANFTALARVIRDQLADITLDRGDGEFQPLDATNIPYAGASNGGTQGLVILATSPEYTRGGAVVPGGGWSHMMQRAVQWNTLGTLFSDRYRDPHELQLAISLSQQLFDPVDSMNYVDRLLVDRVDGRTDVQVQLHMAVGDTQVSNLVTEMVARSGEIPLVSPSPREVYGLDELVITAPSQDEVAGLYVYDEGFEPLPLDNVTPLEENGTHDTVRKLQSYIDQLGPFLEDGTFTYTCEGSCDPE